MLLPPAFCLALHVWLFLKSTQRAQSYYRSAAIKHEKLRGISNEGLNTNHTDKTVNMQNIREKLKRKLSMHDKNPNLDDDYENEDVDDETHGNLSREIEKAEQNNQPQGKPGSLLNRMISHGNKKTEDQIAEDNRNAALSGSGQTTSGQQGLAGGKQDDVIR